MKAVILAAGKGERMGNRFNFKPKCLVTILGLTLIERTLLILSQCGFSEAIVVLGYEGEVVKEKIQLKKFPQLTIAFEYNESWETGNMGSFLKALNGISPNEYFLLLMSDHLYDPEIIRKAAMKIHEQQLVMCYDDSLDSDELAEASKIIVNEKGDVVSTGKNMESSLADCGAMVLNGNIAASSEKPAIAKELSEMLSNYAKNNHIKALNIHGNYWQDIDTCKDFAKARRKLLKSLVSPREGLISRKINRYVSLRITERIANYGIQPNMISVISFLVSVFSGLFFIFHIAFWGGVIAQLGSIIDGVDGELARAKFLSSKYGGYFESILDRYGDSVIILGMAYYSLALIKFEIVLFVALMALIGSVMSMLSKEKFHSEFGSPYIPDLYDGWTRYLPSNRDGRLFIVFLGGIFDQVFPALIVLAILSNFHALYRLMYSVKKIKVK